MLKIHAFFLLHVMKIKNKDGKCRYLRLTQDILHVWTPHNESVDVCRTELPLCRPYKSAPKWIFHNHLFFVINIMIMYGIKYHKNWKSESLFFHVFVVKVTKSSSLFPYIVDVDNCLCKASVDHKNKIKYICFTLWQQTVVVDSPVQMQTAD